MQLRLMDVEPWPSGRRRIDATARGLCGVRPLEGGASARTHKTARNALRTVPLGSRSRT